MAVVEKKARGHSYLYLVESIREGRKVRQRIVQPLGRKDVLAASGQLERLLQSVARHCGKCFCGCRPLCKRFRLVWSRDRVRFFCEAFVCGSLEGRWPVW